MKQKLLITAISTLIAALIFAFWPKITTVLTIANNPQAIVTTLQDSGIWGMLALVALLILQVFLAFIPGQALMVASGYLYGFVGGTLLTWISLTLGGQVAFSLARHFGRPFATRFISPEVLQRWNKVANQQGIGFYMMSLVLPIFPNDAMCYVAGLGTISRRRFLVANTLGRLIASVLTAFIGAYGSQISVSVWITLAILAGLVALIWKNRSFFQSKVEVNHVSL